MQKRNALIVSLLVLVAAPQARAVEILGVSTATARGTDPIDMGRACHATFAASRVCDSRDLKRATSIAPLPANQNDPYINYVFNLVPKAAVGTTILDELGTFVNTGGAPVCGRSMQNPNGTTYYSSAVPATSNDPSCTAQVLCCSDQ